MDLYFFSGLRCFRLTYFVGWGLGTREFVFVQGADYFHLDGHLGVIISLLFYLSNVLSSVWGAYFIFHDPLGE